MRGMCPDKYDFDLPGEAEWEFAARAGNTNGYWNDGTKVLSTTDVDTNLSRLARYKKNGGFIGGTTNPYSSCNLTIGPTNGVAIVGTYAPSAWGLYDIHGNCGEYCLDAWQADITELGGVIVIPTTDGSLAFRGGRYQDDPSTCMLGTRAGTTGYSSAGGGYGMRVAVHAGLK